MNNYEAMLRLHILNVYKNFKNMESELDLYQRMLLDNQIMIMVGQTSDPEFVFKKLDEIVVYDKTIDKFVINPS